MGCNGEVPTLRRSMSLPSSSSTGDSNKNVAEAGGNQTVRPYNMEDCTLNNSHRRDNLKYNLIPARVGLMQFLFTRLSYRTLSIFSKTTHRTKKCSLKQNIDQIKIANFI
jgi:hypothetical protein